VPAPIRGLTLTPGLGDDSWTLCGHMVSLALQPPFTFQGKFFAQTSSKSQDHLHYLTCSCYHRQPWLATPHRRDLFSQILEEVRQRYRLVVVGYVVMPEHIHLLISEPERGTPSTMMQVVKQRFARRVLSKKRRSAGQGELWEDQEQHVWQRRFYDFNVWSAHKRIEKLRYMHRNPVRRGLVLEAKQLVWSSFRSYAYGEEGRVKINQWPGPVLKIWPAA
jgi:putative transposase